MIIWSNQAKVSYEKIIDDLLDRWTIEVAYEFENLTNELLDRLIVNRNLCPSTLHSHLRKCIVHKNSSLIYMLKGSDIVLVTFVINSSGHKYF
jgi:plasmid stabilization system protein ParE